MLGTGSGGKTTILKQAEVINFDKYCSGRETLIEAGENFATERDYLWSEGLTLSVATLWSCPFIQDLLFNDSRTTSSVSSRRWVVLGLVRTPLRWRTFCPVGSRASG